MHPQTQLRLLSRAECGLCEDMAQALSRLGLVFDTIDIGLDEGLQVKYGETIPVLLDGEKEIARAPQTRASLKTILKRSGYI